MTRAITATRRIQFCAGHRVHNHESKCRNIHGHNYVALFTARIKEPNPHQPLDELGRVIDFSVLKERIGGWIDKAWDHGFIYYAEDEEMHAMFEIGRHKSYKLPTNPTAENMASHLINEICPWLFRDTCIQIVKVELWETENCKATATV